MTDDVVVLGSGYAGTGAIRELEESLGPEADLTWVSAVPHHLVLHEVHRCIRSPEVREKLVYPIEEIAAPDTRFVRGRAEAIDAADRSIALADGSTVAYDYLLVAIGSRTAFFGIDGLRRHALTLKSIEDALAIHEAVTDAGRAATRTDPARVVVGGAGLSGIQAAGEVAEFRDRRRVPIEIDLVEGLDAVFPGNDPVVQAKLRKLLEEKDVTVHTGAFIGEVDDERVYAGGGTELPYDVLVWTGGITGRRAAEGCDVDKDERSHRLRAGDTFRTDDPRVFAVGDAALVDQGGRADRVAPPTAQAAWQAATVAGTNVARAVRGQPLERWRYENKGTLVSVGDEAVAHDVVGFNAVSRTFAGPVAETLKKAVAARWINRVAGPAAAARAWPDM